MSAEPEISEYEAQRNRKIAENKGKLRELGLDNPQNKEAGSTRVGGKKKKRPRPEPDLVAGGAGAPASYSTSPRLDLGAQYALAFAEVSAGGANGKSGNSGNSSINGSGTRRRQYSRKRAAVPLVWRFEGNNPISSRLVNLDQNFTAVNFVDDSPPVHGEETGESAWHGMESRIVVGTSNGDIYIINNLGYSFPFI